MRTAGFEVADAIALLRLDDLFIESFEIKDVKVTPCQQRKPWLTGDTLGPQNVLHALRSRLTHMSRPVT